MKIFKFGFTLSELMIALTIVGVIAATVIPMTIRHIQKNQAGPILGRSVEQIELGCQNIIQTANSNAEDGSYGDVINNFMIKDVNPLSAGILSLYSPLFFEVAIPYLGIETLSSKDADEFKENAKTLMKYNGQQMNNIDIINLLISNKFKSQKTPANIYFYNVVFYDNNINPDKVLYRVAIDTNGNKKPNAWGKDLFEFELTNSCKMMPYGLRDDDKYTNTCNAGQIQDGKSCTARVVADGFKIKY